MKTGSQKVLALAVLCLMVSGIFSIAKAQQKLIYYWNFNNFNSGLSAGVNPATLVPIHSSWSTLDSTKATIAYTIVPGTSKYYTTYWDNNPGDTLNLQKGAVAGLALRVRNPSDSMQLLFTMPTMHYKNLSISFETEKSSLTSGMGKQVFDYSPDGGTTWKTSGLSIASDSLTSKAWGLVTVSIATDTTVNNNPNFIFRIKFANLNTGTSGNNRFDNVTLEGDTDEAPSKTPPPPSQKLIYYWNFNNFNSGLSAGVNPSTLTPIHSSWSTIDSTKATIAYTTVPGTSKYYTTYWDNNPGDTLNLQKGAVAGLALRIRNPSDSMQLLFAMPTNRYKNLTFSFETEKSSLTSGMGKQVFDYSPDGGTTWKTSGLSIASDSLTSKNWGLVTVSIASDTTVNNNPNFIFRIKFVSLTTGTSGNNRFDNVTLAGDTDNVIIKTPPPPSSLKLIHYWHFNNFVGLTGAGSPSLIVPFHANWSSLDSTKAVVAYVPSYTVSPNYATYWDATTGDTINSRLAERDQTTGVNNCLRVRNPSDSMELRFYIPTTHYKNINIKYELEKSSLTSGQGKQVFDYSTDRGSTWSTTGLSISGDSVANTNWNLIALNLNTDTTVNNDPDFIFRIKFKTQNSSTSGNNRFDNFTVEGDTDEAPVINRTSGIAEAVNKNYGYNLYPNPAGDKATVSSGNVYLKTISLYDMNGRMLSSLQSTETNVPINLEGLNSGIYLVHIMENKTGTMANLKLIKN